MHAIMLLCLMESSIKIFYSPLMDTLYAVSHLPNEFHCPLQYHFRFAHHVFSTANRKQLLKLNSLIGLQHYIIPGWALLHVAHLGLCSAQPVWPYSSPVLPSLHKHRGTQFGVPVFTI